MSKNEILDEWELGTDPRYKKQNMERAMKGQIVRGLVELITNSDDSYHNLEEEGKQATGKIRIEIDRRKMGQPSIVAVRDRAEGMDRKGMFDKLGTLGRRTSGFEKGKQRRGLHGRGARDIAAFGTVHFESIKGEEYNHLVIPPSLNCRFTEHKPTKVTNDIRKQLSIQRGNGTVVTIEVESRFKIPQHGALAKDFSRYYSLRDIFANREREVMLVDLKNNRKEALLYNYPCGVTVFNGEIEIPDYASARAHLVLYKYLTAFEQDILPYREGITIKSAAAIHDCTYFGLESEPLAWRFTGVLYCEFVDQLIREYEDREEANPDNPKHPANNPVRLLDPFRDGLIPDHPFARAIYKRSREILQSKIEELKTKEKPSKLDVTDEDLERKLKSLSREVSRIFEERLKELEEEITPEPPTDRLSIGLHIIPPEEQPIIVNKPKTFSIILKHYEALNEALPVNITSSNPEIICIRSSPVFLRKFSEEDKLGRTTFTVESTVIGAEAFIEASYAGYNNMVLVKVIEPPPPPRVQYGLTFEKPFYHLQINREKNILLRLKTTNTINQKIVDVSSDHPEIVVKGGSKCILHETEIEGVLSGECNVMGRQLKAIGNVQARIEGFEPAQTRVEVFEKREPTGGIDFKPPRPVEEDFGALRYKWDNKEAYLLLIGAKHPSIKKYLGEPTENGYAEVNSKL